ncbi:hypothetical protein N8448_02675 [Gammaproteobacteria bacterium]|nr:hypothetical protein [Gammaproteobacteria bacterium]
MIVYRKYIHENDYDSYKIFCEKNFGKGCYQSKADHINWLESNPSHFIDVAAIDNKIIGCFHGFKAPVKVNNKTILFYSLHDLMVDKEKGSQLGLKLMQGGIIQDVPVILSGAVGRISRAYKRLGSLQFKSHWYRKFIIPIKPFKFFFLNRLKIKYIQDSMEFNFINNKQSNSQNLIAPILDSFSYENESSKNFFKWRFLQKDSPLTFFVSDDSHNNIIIFSLGVRKFIPFLRVISVKNDNNNAIAHEMLKSVELFASRSGIPVILYSVTEDSPPPKILKYNKYKNFPNSYIFSKKNKLTDDISINGFSTDLGFDSYSFKGFNDGS